MNSLRTKNGLAPGDLGTLSMVNGGHVKVLVLAVERHTAPAVVVRLRVTSPTRYGYTQGEEFTTSDTAFLTRRPRVGEPPNGVIMDALGSPGRTFVWHDAYGGGWTRWDRPPGNAPFWTIDGPRA